MSHEHFLSGIPVAPIAQDADIDIVMDTEFKWNGMQYRVTKQGNGKYLVEGKVPHGWMRTSNPDVLAEARKALGL